MTAKTLEFWYEFASTYSYLTALRIDTLTADAGVTLIWRPFLLGPIFHAQGWTSSPFNIYPAKGRHMVRDIERIAARRGHAFRMPDVFPANGLLAARVALCGERNGWIAPFSRAVYEAEFAGGADISNTAVLKDILKALNLDADAILKEAYSPEIKDALRQQSARAQQLDIFGAPTFITPDGELFWGDDRLEQAIAWTLNPQSL